MAKSTVRSVDRTGARQQELFFGGSNALVNNLKRSYEESLNKTVTSLSAVEQQAFADARRVLTVIDRLSIDVNQKLEDRIYQMQFAANQVLDQIPFTRSRPSVFAVVTRDLREEVLPSTPDIEVIGFRLFDPADKRTLPDVDVSGTRLSPDTMTLTAAKIAIRLPPELSQQIRLTKDPCNPFKRFDVKIHLKKKESGWFSSSIKNLVPINETIQPEATYEVRAVVAFKPVVSKETATKTISQKSNEIWAANSGPWSKESGDGDVSIVLPEGAVVKEKSARWVEPWGAVDTTQANDPKVAGNVVSVSGTIWSKQRWKGRARGRILLTVKYELPIEKSKPREDQTLGPILQRGDEAVEIGSIGDGTQVQRVHVSVFRRGCESALDTIELIPNPVGASAATGVKQLYRAELQAGQISVAPVNR